MIYIQEMAESRKVIKDKLIDTKMRELIEHLIRLIVFDSPNNKNHWRGEVYGLFNNIPRMKHNKQPPDKNFMFQTIWNWYGDRLDFLTKSVFRQEPNKKLKENKSSKDFAIEIETKVKSYISWLTDRLSKTTEVNKSEVYAELDSLGL